MSPQGVVAAGHIETARAAEIVLREGGNAFDAVLAAMCAAAVAEPVLASLGGGGFLLAHDALGGPASGRTLVYDFFPETPRHPVPPSPENFFPILADFGPVQQEFHIGMGAIATPGAVKGLFEVHRDLGSMPMARIVEPAVALARGGVAVTAFQAYLFRVVGPILGATAAARGLFHSPKDPGRLLDVGETFHAPDFADALEALAAEGDDLFYRGEIARNIAADIAAKGGSLRREDFEAYRVEKRAPLRLPYRDALLLTNPPPSVGGALIAFALELLSDAAPGAPGFGTAAHLGLLARVMEQTNLARAESGLHEGEGPGAARHRLLDPEFVAGYRHAIAAGPVVRRGTTHISVVDGAGNAASLTLSNGEGSGYVVPGTGMMLNNMLGEEDINPLGFHRWAPGVRLCSMMAPTLIFRPGGRIIATGSGGSNRIRTAILQVLVNLLDFAMPVAAAVAAPRIHFEDGLLSVEHGFDDAEIRTLLADYPDHKLWQEKNLFFGGAHTAAFDPGAGGFAGAGDPRRDGAALVV